MGFGFVNEGHGLREQCSWLTEIGVDMRPACARAFGSPEELGSVAFFFLRALKGTVWALLPASSLPIQGVLDGCLG